jgi:hypothetical protein
MVISVTDENNEPVQFEKVFQPMDCSKSNNSFGFSSVNTQFIHSLYLFCVDFSQNPLPVRLVSSMSSNLLDKIYQKMNEFGSSTDLESFTERGLNVNHLPILDLVVTIISKGDQLRSG